MSPRQPRTHSAGTFAEPGRCDQSTNKGVRAPSSRRRRYAGEQNCRAARSSLPGFVQWNVTGTTDGGRIAPLRGAMDRLRQ
jgi:hypothetical protein